MASQSNPPITRDQVQRIFAGVETIIGVNSTLLSELEEKLKTYDRQKTSLGDVFKSFV